MDPLAGVLFIPGAGRVGASAWPGQAKPHPDWCYAEDSDFASTSTALAELERAHVVAHSHGAITALALAASRPEAVLTLALFEPACMSIARGTAAVEEHVAALSPVVARAADPSLSDDDYARLFLHALGAPPPTESSDTARWSRLRRLPVPWDTPVDLNAVGSVRTLVITGGWSDLQEDIALVLGAAGAERLVLEGFGHRPQDHPEATQLLMQFWRHQPDVR